MNFHRVSFRKIKGSEFEAILQLLDMSFPITRQQIENDLRETQKYPKANGDIYGLWVGGKLVGTVIYGALYVEDEDWNGEGLIRYLAVHPKHRRKGYASWIIKRSIVDLKQAKSPCVVISVLVEDKIAVKIWKGFGFEYYDTQEPDAYGTHHNYVLWL